MVLIKAAIYTRNTGPQQRENDWLWRKQVLIFTKRDNARYVSTCHLEKGERYSRESVHMCAKRRAQKDYLYHKVCLG